MHYLYIDESGDEGRYLDRDGNFIEGSSKCFTSAGIIVEKSLVPAFNAEHNNLISKYFSKIRLPGNFKLHYSPLRTNKFPYNQISDKDKRGLETDVFDIINRLDCALLSVTINLHAHYERYERPVSPRAYSLLLLLERFQYFLEDSSSQGIAIYERFNAKMRKKVMLETKWLQNYPKFAIPTKLNNIHQHIKYGDPTKEPILNLADFFAYLPFTYRIKMQIPTHFKSIEHKYFRGDGSWLRGGRVEL